MKKVLIIGSSGFIGRNIYEYLKEKYEIVAPTSKELDVTNEIEVTNYLEQNYFDVIIHSAVYNTKDINGRLGERMLKDSLKMFFNFEKNQCLYGKMIYFGSGAEYDKRYDIKHIQEENFGEKIPSDDYGFAKYIINKSIMSSSNIYNLRLFGVYGKYEHWKSKFISNACCKVINGIPISIRQNVFFDYLFIDDLCKIVEYFIINDVEYRQYNVASGKRIDLFTLAEKVLMISEKRLPIYVCKQGLGKEYTADNSRLINEMGQIKFTNIDIGIKELYMWYKENINKVDLYSLLYQ